MAHLSLYRRFRPDTFDKIVRQEHVVRVLTNQIKSGSVGHAYLFTGPRGTGKTSVARIFARAVNCEHPKDGSPCGVCPTCKALASGSLDITEIDAASNNGVAEMRDLREKVQYPPVSGKYKVYIVDEVHMLTDSAFNALLKTLEEPPAHAIFILATTEPHKLPATILSRCMRLDFKLIPETDLEEHLKRILGEIGKEYEPEAVAAIARAGAGSDRDMLSVAEMCIAYGDKLTYADVVKALGAADFRGTCAFVGALLRSDAGEAILTVERLLAEGKSASVLCRDLIEMLGRVSVAKTCRDAERILSLPSELFALVKELADNADGRAILRATEQFSRTETELRFASSPRILLEAAVIRTACPSTESDVDALTVRIAGLERRIEELTERLSRTGAPAPNAASEPAPAPVRQAEPEPEPEPEPVPFDDFVPPPEEEWYEPELAPRAREQAPAPKPAEKLEPVTPPKSATEAFGRFIRSLRKNAKNGVLFTMCSDLEAKYEGEKLVLLTTSEMVFRSLNRAEHRAVMDETFAGIGVTDFEIRLDRGDKGSADGLEELRNTFKDYPIDIK